MASNATAVTTRAHHTNAAQGEARSYTIIIELEDRPGAVDRVVGVLRRRRSLMESFSLTPSVQPEHVRITALVHDAQVVIDHLIAQMRKVIDVKSVEIVDTQHAVVREFALIRVDVAQSDFNTIIATSQQFGASVIDVIAQAVTLEVTGSSEKLDRAIEALQSFGIREIARSGSIAITRSDRAQEK